MKGSSLVYAISSHKDFVPAPGLQVQGRSMRAGQMAAEALPFLGDVDEDLSGRYKLQRRSAPGT